MTISDKDKEKILKLNKISHNLFVLKNNSPEKINKRDTIDLYHEWRTESEIIFEKYFPEDNRLVKKFKSFMAEGNGYELMDKCFSPQLPIYNYLIEQLEEGIMDTKPESHTIQEIFISHSSKDKFIVESFVDLILDNGLTVDPTNIFCTSLDGMKIESGEDWRNYIQDRLKNAKITFLIITPNYKESEICLNEMGASWVLSSKVIPLIVEPIDYESVGVLMNVKQIEKLIDEKSLDMIKDIVQTKLKIPSESISSPRWTSKKTEFLLKVESYLKKNQFKIPLVRNEFDKLFKVKTELETTVTNLISEKEEKEKFIIELKKLKDKEQIKKVESKFDLSDEYDQFKALLNKVHALLDQFHPIIIGLFFKEFSQKSIEVNIVNYPEAISTAIARDIIDEDLTPLWEYDGTQAAIKVKKALVELERFMQKQLSTEFYEKYNDKYEPDFNINNIDFWADVIGVTVYLS